MCVCIKMATKLHEGKCGPCHLCEQESTKYTHLEKMDCVVAKLICDLYIYAEKCVYAMHATNKHRQMLITQLFSHVGSQKQALPKAICSVDTSDELKIEKREQIENFSRAKTCSICYIVLLPLVLHSVSPTIYVCP